MRYQKAPDIKYQIGKLVTQLHLNYINLKNIHCIRSFDVKTRAIARIWGMSRLFKEVAGIDPHYIIEVNSRRFDKLDKREKIKTLIHELLHIPKTFSGALLPHRGRYHSINDAEVEKLLQNRKISI